MQRVCVLQPRICEPSSRVPATHAARDVRARRALQRTGQPRRRPAAPGPSGVNAWVEPRDSGLRSRHVERRRLVVRITGGRNQQRRCDAESTDGEAPANAPGTACSNCNPGGLLCGPETITAGIGVRMRTADAVTGVCVTGGGSGGAIAQGHAGIATGDAGDAGSERSWWQQHVSGRAISTWQTTAAAPAKPDNCDTSASARKKRLICRG